MIEVRNLRKSFGAKTAVNGVSFKVEMGEVLGFLGHSFKYAAAMQAAQSGPTPVLIRIETRAGHGAGKPTSKVIEEVTDQ